MNNKIYIGCHRTTDLDDGYLGSGILIQKAIKKYGSSMFRREILAECNSAEEMFDLESQYVTKMFVAQYETYNLCAGGYGSDMVLANKAYSLKTKTDPEWKDTVNKKISEALKGRPGVFTGKKHKPETIANMRKIRKGHGTGKENSQYGTCWIHNNNVSKKINKDDLNEYLTDGWIVGRKMKF